MNSVVEIFPETMFYNGLLQVFVGGSYQSKVNFGMISGDPAV